MTMALSSSFPREALLLGPLVEWLGKRRWIRHDTLLVTEFPWCGRYVDLAVLTKSAKATAFELKLRDNGRALEQAASNALSFDRSYVVTATNPKSGFLARAHEVGVGVILLGEGTLRVLKEAQIAPRSPLLRPRLLARLKNVDPCLSPTLTM
jgi:hypothetical protein